MARRPRGRISRGGCTTEELPRGDDEGGDTAHASNHNPVDASGHGRTKGDNEGREEENRESTALGHTPQIISTSGQKTEAWSVPCFCENAGASLGTGH